MQGTACGWDFSVAVLEDHPGLLVLEVLGARAFEYFCGESGGHRWQASSPTGGKKGRIHTSTITVAVMPATREAEAKLLDRDIEWEATRGSGAGGQARNKTSNAVMMKHVPSGLRVRVESERSQSQNREAARRLLAAKLLALAEEALAGAARNARRTQVGTGQRGDKRRTYRVKDDRAVDHITGRTTRLSRVMDGHLEDLHAP